MQRIATYDTAADCCMQHSSGLLNAMQQWIAMHGAAADHCAYHSSGSLHVMQQWLTEQGVDARDPLSHMLWHTWLNMTGFLTTRDKTLGTKGTHHPNPSNTRTQHEGKGILGVGVGVAFLNPRVTPANP